MPEPTLVAPFIEAHCSPNGPCSYQGLLLGPRFVVKTVILAVYNIYSRLKSWYQAARNVVRHLLSSHLT